MRIKDTKISAMAYLVYVATFVGVVCTGIVGIVLGVYLVTRLFNV